MASIYSVSSYSSLWFFLLALPKFALPVVILSLRNHNHADKQNPGHHGNHSSCDLFLGTWIKDDTYPLYQSSSCPAIDPQFNCQMYGRPDSTYQRFRWKPLNCDPPRFDGLRFLSIMKGKTIIFVGNSLGRNQWESLVCMIHSYVPKSQVQLINEDPLFTFKFIDYGVAISFHKAQYLVDIDTVQGKRVLKLDDISENGAIWRGANVLSFNSGHWWNHRGSLQGWDYIEERGEFYTDMDRVSAFEKALRTWANWVGNNVDRSKTKVFFQSTSPTHYNPSEWGGSPSSNCYGETMPVSGWSYSGQYPVQMKVIQTVLNDMNNPPYLLDVTTLSELRKDGHPSLYSGELSPQEKSNPEKADCSHWCLPGVPDAWNELFYALLF